MPEPGDRRLPDEPAATPSVPPDTSQAPLGRRTRVRSWRTSVVGATLLACGVGLLAALAWAALRSVLDLTVGSLVVAALGGWGIGAAIRDARAPWILAGVIGAAAWALALLFSWALAMAILPGSSRPLLERLEGTPFTDWLAPQFGLLELAGLIVMVGLALVTARPAAPR